VGTNTDTAGVHLERSRRAAPIRIK